MQTKPIVLSVALLFGLSHVTANAQGTTFTYEGFLSDSNGSVNDAVRMQFRIYAGPSVLLPALWQETHPSVPVTNGLFSVVLGRTDPADETLFNGSPRWLGIAVNGGAEMTPRTQITAVPYAITAGHLTGVLPASALSGTYSAPVALNNLGNSFNGNGAGLTGLNASRLATGTVPLPALGNAWRISGNNGTTPGTHFLGTTDDQPLELKVNAVRSLRLESGGDSSDPDSEPDGAPNVIGGAPNNSVAAGVAGATIAGGGATNYQGLARPNSIEGDYSTISGGHLNAIQFYASRSVIAGGTQNIIRSNAFHSAIGGGNDNDIAALAIDSTISGGRMNGIGRSSDGGAIGGGLNNNIELNCEYATISGGYLNNLGSNSSWSAIGGGRENNVAGDSFYCAIAGGSLNDIGDQSDNSVIGGGRGNRIANDTAYGTIAGGGFNSIGTNSDHSFIGGGEENNIARDSRHSAIAGGSFNDIGSNSIFSVVSGGSANRIGAYGASSTVAGGNFNRIGTNATGSAIGGGLRNDMESDLQGSTIAGGSDNGIFRRSTNSTIGGGFNNNIGGDAPYATIPGGDNNFATARALAAGTRAKANHTGTFVWADSQSADFPSTAINQVSFRCQGGVRFTSGNGAANQTVSWTPGGAAWSFSSDRSLKEGVRTVDPLKVLEKVCDLPVAEWNYQGHSQRHIGPMAQDFHALFPLNENERMIDTGDLHGVALAAIQGLNQKLEAQLKTKDTEIRELRQGLAELKATLKNLTTKTQE